MSATQYNAGLFNAKYFGWSPVGGIAPSYPTSHAIFFNTTSVTLKWHNKDGFSTYEVQVSLTADFLAPFKDTTGITDNNTTFTDSQGNGTRRWWRWRGSYDGGATYARWSRVASYWLDTTAAQSIVIPRNTWMLINPSPNTDTYLFQIFPFYKTMPQLQYRTRTRNRLGTMLTEYITIKVSVTLGFDDTRWLKAVEFSEARRFNETVKTFFVAIFNDYELGEPVPNIWKVQFDTDPDLSMFNAGRQDMLVGNLVFTEV